jgi:6-phosphogluconolactonase
MRAAANRIVGLAAEAIASHGRFDWALAGGSTPAALYRLLTERDFRGRIAWPQVHFFWGDERCVPPDDPESNYGMVRRAMLDELAPPPQNVHRLEGELAPALAADRYQAELERHFALPAGSSPPTFDLIVLGMGADGHTASLFPGTAGLEEKRRWVVANRIESLGTTRLTLTLPVINAAAHVLFLVSGGDKAERLTQVLSRAQEGDPLPAQRVRPRGGDAEWFVDAPAAARLEGARD